MFEYRAPAAKDRTELETLCAAYTGKVKRLSGFIKARRELPGRAGNYARHFIEIPVKRKVQYAANAYRADKKTAKALPLGIAGPSVAATRDYIKR